MLSALLAVSNASLMSGSPMYLTSQPYQTVNERRKPTLWWTRWHLPQTINKTLGSTAKLKSPLIVISKISNKDKDKDKDRWYSPSLEQKFLDATSCLYTFLCQSLCLSYYINHFSSEWTKTLHDDFIESIGQV